MGNQTGNQNPGGQQDYNKTGQNTPANQDGNQDFKTPGQNQGGQQNPNNMPGEGGQEYGNKTGSTGNTPKNSATEIEDES